jgi:lysine-specific histone demethylase 1
MHQLAATCPIFDHTGKPVPQELDQGVEKRFNEILTEAAKCPRETFTSLGKAVNSLIEKVQPNELEMSLFNWHFANLEYGCAAELELVDLHHWDQDDQFELGGGHYLIPTGYGAWRFSLHLSPHSPCREHRQGTGTDNRRSIEPRRYPRVSERRGSRCAV